MLLAIRRALWGDVTTEELKQFGLLSMSFFFVVGSYWMLRELKNAWFMELVGPAGLPYAKGVSIVSLVCLLVFYNKLVNILEKTHLLYFLAVTYGTLFLIIAACLARPELCAIDLTAHLHWLFAGRIITVGWLLGWLLYVGIESFGSLAVASFWSYVSSVTEMQQAKRCYPLLVAGAQLGAIVGSLANLLGAQALGGSGLFALAGGSIFLVPLLINVFHKHHGMSRQEVREEKKAPTGVFEGLKLLVAQPYLLGILVVSTIYEVISAIFDYLMNSSAKATLGTLERVIEFQGIYGLATNVLTFLFALLGTSYLIRRFGLVACLVAYPTMVAVLVLAVWQFPGLWMFFGAQVGLKALSYALNNPCKEIMYIPTSKDVKFKAKSWVDVQGGRSAKGLGAIINAHFPVVADLIFFGSIISLGMIAFWIPVAYYVGRKNQELTRTGHIIE